jgi:hypothetical protein
MTRPEVPQTQFGEEIFSSRRAARRNIHPPAEFYFAIDPLTGLDARSLSDFFSIPRLRRTDL